MYELLPSERPRCDFRNKCNHIQFHRIISFKERVPLWLFTWCFKWEIRPLSQNRLRRHIIGNMIVCHERNYHYLVVYVYKEQLKSTPINFYCFILEMAPALRRLSVRQYDHTLPTCNLTRITCTLICTNNNFLTPEKMDIRSTVTVF